MSKFYFPASGDNDGDQEGLSSLERDQPPSPEAQKKRISHNPNSKNDIPECKRVPLGENNLGQCAKSESFQGGSS